MRDVVAWCSMLSWLAVAAGACVPPVPSTGKRPPPAVTPPNPDPGTAGAPWAPTADTPGGAPSRGGAPHTDAGGGAPSANARADGGATDRPPGADARLDVAPDARGDGGHVEATGSPDAPAARAPRAGEIVIDEVLVDPAGNDLGHEWIEIVNLAPEPLDLAGLRVSDGATEVAVDAGLLAAGGVLVLGQSIDRAHNGDAPVDLAYGTRLSLNNGADRIAICLGPCAGGVTLDAVAWTAPWGDAYAGHAVVVERGGATCPAEEPYGAGGNFGSPGRGNPPCPPAVVVEADAGGDVAPARDGGAER